MVGVAVAVLSGSAAAACVGEAEGQGDARPDRAACRAPRARTRRIERRIDALLQQDDARREAQPADAAERRADQRRARRPSRSAAVFSLTDPAKIDHYQQIAVQAVAAAHPDPVRLRHDPRVPDDLPDPAGHGDQLRPGGRARRTTRSAPRSRRPSASSRSTARWSTSRTSRAGAASPRARGEDPYLQLRDGRRARQGRAGQRLLAPTTRSSRASSTSPPTAQPESGRDYNTTDMSLSRLWNLYLPPFKAAVDAGADTVMCSFNAINGDPGCANSYTREPHPQAAVGLRRLHRERLHGGRRAARLPAGEPGQRPVRPRHRRGRRRGGREGAQRRHRLRDGLDQLPRLRRPSSCAAAACR